MTRGKKARGQVLLHRFDSRVLRGNPLKDPHERDLYVYLPPGFDARGARKLPALLALTGFTGTGAGLFSPDPWGESLAQRLDRLILSGQCPPVVVAAPDCFTRLGGSQYLDSSAIGRYETYLVREVVPFVSKTYGVGPWGVFGKSSGGYGAIVLGLRHPGLFRALADHSGDSHFELAYLRDFPEALDAWRAAGGPARWLKKLWADPNPKRRKYHAPLNALAMAAAYSPDPRSKDLGIAFPFDLKTGAFKPEVWRRWQAWDPVRLARRRRAAARRLGLAFVDCGSRDEFSLHWGSRALAAELKAAGARVVYEEFDDGHMNLSYRYDRSLPLLARALTRLSRRSR